MILTHFVSIYSQYIWLITFCLQEWGVTCPHEYIGSYKLEYDMSWTPINEIQERSEQFALIDKIFASSQKAITDTVTASVLGSSVSKDNTPT